jgi:hypothetical protein
MKRILLSTLALGALTSAALAAERVPLTDQQMDSVTAGRITEEFISATNPGGGMPPGQQDADVPNEQFMVQTENQNPAGQAPPGQN